VKRACGHDRPVAVPRRLPAPHRLRFRDVVEFSSEEVFEVCGRLALAHQALVREGDTRAAIELAWVFDLIERRVVG
jgi:hypothetical protein